MATRKGKQRSPLTLSERMHQVNKSLRQRADVLVCTAAVNKRQRESTNLEGFCGRVSCGERESGKRATDGPFRGGASRWQRFRFQWIRLWGARLGTLDELSLSRTLAASDDVQSSHCHLKGLCAIGDAKMRRLPLRRELR